MISVLMICTGNICRSPMAEGVLRQLAQDAGLAEFIQVDSAGTTDYHQGEAPDRRAQAASIRRGVDISAQQARQVRTDDIERFDYIMAMDQSHMQYLKRLSRHSELASKLYLFADFAAGNTAREVDDPYYGGTEGFEQALDLIEQSAQGLLAHIRRQHGL